MRIGELQLAEKQSCTKEAAPFARKEKGFNGKTRDETVNGMVHLRLVKKHMSAPRDVIVL